MSDAVQLLANIHILDADGTTASSGKDTPATELSPGDPTTSTLTVMPAKSCASASNSADAADDQQQCSPGNEMSSVTTSLQQTADDWRPPVRARSTSASSASNTEAFSRHTSLSPAERGEAAEAAPPKPKRRTRKGEASRAKSTERSQSDLVVQAKPTAAERKQANESRAHFLKRSGRVVVRRLTWILLSPVYLVAYVLACIRAGLWRVFDYLFGSLYRLFIMSVCVATRRSEEDSLCVHGMPRRLKHPAREPTRPPSPDLSHLTDEERQLLAATVGRLKTENESEQLRIRRAEDQLQVYATKLGESFSDFEVVCDACLQVKHCVEVPNQNKQEKLLICSECMLPLLSGSWYHGMDTSETVDVCSDLIRKASPKVPPRGGSRRGDEEDHQQRTLAELAGPSPGDVVDDEDEFEAACRELEAKRQQAMSERCMARSPSLPISDFADDHPGATSPTGSLTASQADERKDDVPPLDAPFQDRRRPSGATAQLNLPLPGSPSTPTLLSSPAVGESFSEGEFSDNMSMSTFAQSEYSASDLAPGLLPNQIAGQEPVGELEIGLQMGIEANKQRSSFIVDILRGYNFKHWENVGDKPNFEIYIKCYIIFPGRVVKMKTKSVKPSAQPEVLDQLISLMNRKLLQKAERLKVQLWEDHGPLKKKLAVGVATIDLTKLSSSELVMGCYPLYVPARRSPKPSTPTSPSVANVSPGGTPLSLSRSGSGRFGSLRNSFKRREKLRPRSSTGGATAAAAAPSSPLVSEGQLSSSAPTGSPALSSTPSRRLRYGSELGETDL